MEGTNSLILSAVIDDLKRREAKGLETYGTTIDRTDLSQLEWMTHLYEELLDASLYIKKLIHAQGHTDHQKIHQGNVGETATSGTVGNTGATLRKVPEGIQPGGGEGCDELEDDSEYSEGEDRLLICSTQIESAVNALYSIEGKDVMLLGTQQKQMIQEIEAMSMHITYRALAEIYQSVFQLPGDGVDN